MVIRDPFLVNGSVKMFPGNGYSCKGGNGVLYTGMRRGLIKKRNVAISQLNSAREAEKRWRYRSVAT
jgi:hypothetical protein